MSAALAASEITKLLGGRWSGRSGLCRCPAHDDRNPSLAVSDGDDGRLLLHCFTGCDFRDIHRALIAKGIVEDDEASRCQRPSPAFSPAKRHAKPLELDRSRLADALGIFRASTTITANDPAGRYLTGRGCILPPDDSHLRWVDGHHHPCGYVGPALIALATNSITGEPQTLHRTWIDPTCSGQKAPIDKPRLLFGGLPKAGAVVRLWPDAEVTDGLAVGEGIETCLVAAQGFTPIWSTLDAGNLAAFPILPGIEALMIIADHDPAGLKAAEQCARRWHEAGREVRGWCSPIKGEDAADFLARAA